MKLVDKLIPFFNPRKVQDSCVAFEHEVFCCMEELGVMRILYLSKQSYVFVCCLYPMIRVWRLYAHQGQQVAAQQAARKIRKR